MDFPLPQAPNWLAGLLFLEGGRSWTGSRFGSDADDPFQQERFFRGAGTGLVFRSSFGHVELSVGAKFNPSAMDLASREDIIDAVLNQLPIDGLPTKDRRRFQLHLSFGVER